MKHVVHILGHRWIIKEQSTKVNPLLNEYAGYCDWTTRTIVIRNDLEGNLGDMQRYMRKVARHEITHAFLCEAGLNECAHETDCWALNEEMVDWIANVGPTLYKAWQEVGVEE